MARAHPQEPLAHQPVPRSSSTQFRTCARPKSQSLKIQPNSSQDILDILLLECTDVCSRLKGCPILLNSDREATKTTGPLWNPREQPRPNPGKHFWSGEGRGSRECGPQAPSPHWTCTAPEWAVPTSANHQTAVDCPPPPPRKCCCCFFFVQLFFLLFFLCWRPKDKPCVFVLDWRMSHFGGGPHNFLGNPSS